MKEERSIYLISVKFTEEVSRINIFNYNCQSGLLFVAKDTYLRILFHFVISINWNANAFLIRLLLTLTRRFISIHI